MKKKEATPAQKYAKGIIEAVDSFLVDPENTEWADEIQMLVMTRPKTLRAAMAMYLHKSENAHLYRYNKPNWL